MDVVAINGQTYDLDLVDTCFANHAAAPQDDSALLERISNAYIKAKAVQKDLAPIYQATNVWTAICAGPHAEVSAALLRCDIPALQRIYGNFWREPCSFGLHGLPLDMQQCFFNGGIRREHRMCFVSDMLYRFATWRKRLGELGKIADAAALEAPGISNPYGFYVDGYFARICADYQHYYATAIGELMKVAVPRHVVEVGGGYGGMAYYLLRDQPGLAYVDLDLPENAALTAYYLIKSLPQRRIRLFGETMPDCSVAILPSFEVGHLVTGGTGLVFNSYSLAEMSVETVAAYLAAFARIIAPGGHFLHLNSGGIADGFPVDYSRFTPLYRKAAPWNFGNNPYTSECEYLYRKTA